MKFVFDDFESSYDYLHVKVIFIALHLQGLKCVPTAFETYKIFYGNGPVYTVFYRIHAPAQKPKCPEGRLYSSQIRSKSTDVDRLRGFPSCQFHFQRRENRAFLLTQLNGIK